MGNVHDEQKRIVKILNKTHNLIFILTSIMLLVFSFYKFEFRKKYLENYGVHKVGDVEIYTRNVWDWADFTYIFYIILVLFCAYLIYIVLSKMLEYKRNIFVIFSFKILIAGFICAGSIDAYYLQESYKSWTGEYYVEASNLPLIMYAPIFIFSFVLFVFYISRLILTIKSNKQQNLVHDDFVMFKTKKHRTIIDVKNMILTYGEDIIKISEIEEIELLNNSKVIAKSGITEALLAGVLFGGIGALAGAYSGKKEKTIHKYKLSIKTNNWYCANVYIAGTLEDCTKIADTLFLLLKHINKGKINI